MLDGFECYWKDLRSRIQARLNANPCLEGLVVKRRRINVNNGKLSYRTKRGRLVPHSYTQDVSVEKLS